MSENIKLLISKELKRVNINVELSKDKELIKENDYSLYLKVQELYQKALDSYLLSNTSIKLYDNMIKQSNLDFGIMPSSMRNLYHLMSYLNLDYIYIRNFLFIEKLSKDDLDIFFRRITKEDFSIDEEILDVVVRTYREVINDNFRNGEYRENTTSCYGSAIPINVVSSNKLVLVIQYGKNTKEMSKEEFLKNYKMKKEFLSDIEKRLEECISNELQIETKVLIRSYVGE